MVAYTAAYSAGFIWDDDSHLTKNPCVVGPLGLQEIWTTAAATYYPLVLTTFWVVHKFAGLNPAPYHVLNVLWHVANAILLWRVLRRLNIRGAWLAAALWSVHPVMVQSVAWITEMKNTQSAFFYLLAVLCFLRWQESRPRAATPFFAAILFSAMAIASKSSTVVLPAVLLFCIWWRNGRLNWRDIFALAPFAFLTAVASGWTIWEQKYHSGALGAEWTHTVIERVIIACCDVWFYLGKLLWPHPLIFNYPRWAIDSGAWLSYGPVAATIVGGVALWIFQKRSRAPLFASAYFIAALLPVLGFFDVYFFRYAYVSDHFQYLASMGPTTLAASVITAATERLQQLQRSIAALLLAVLGLLTWRQTQIYHDEETLWRATLKLNSNSWLGQGCLGGIFYRRGEISAAMSHYENAVRLAPHDPETHSNLAAALFREGKVPDAITQWQESLSIKPNDVEVRGYFANALIGRGRVAEAIMQLRESLRLQPRNVDVINSLAVAVSQTGRIDEAIALWKQAVELQPTNEGALYNLTWVLATSADDSIRDGAKAVEFAKRLLLVSAADNPRSLRALAAADAEAGVFSEAVDAASRALQSANVQGDTALAERLQRELARYQANTPLRDIR